MSSKSYVKNLLAIGCGVLLVLVLEGGLALFGVVPLADEDPFVGFSGKTPLFVEATPGRYTLNPVKAKYFNSPQSFTLPKPVGTFRIVIFGGSTTYGRPYLNKTSYGTWLEKLIEKYADNVDVEVINAGGISYASYRVRRLMQEMVNYDPDLFVLYSGHNEFLEARTFADLREEQQGLRLIRQVAHHSRIYSVLTQLLGRSASQVTFDDDVDATLEQIGGPELYHRDPEFRAGVIRQYQHEIGEMVRLCKQQGVPLVLSTLPVNLSGVAPFKSEHDSQLNREDLQRWQRAFARGEDALNNMQPERALTALAEAEKIDNDYALLHYRKGQAYARLGNVPKAYEAYDRAREEDIVPLRALNEFNQIIRSTALSAKVPLADVEKFFMRISPGHLPGNNLFVDHVHPSIEGQQLIAWVIMNAATEAALLPIDTKTWQEVMPQARDYLRRELALVSERYQAMGYWGVGRLFFWAGKYPEAYVALRQAWQSVQDVAEMARQLGELELMRGDVKKALEYLDASERLEPGHYKVLLARASAMNRSGRAQESLDMLLQVKVPAAKTSVLNYTLGQTMLALGRPGEAVDYLNQAVAGKPDIQAYRFELAEALKQSGRKTEALEAYRKYLALLANPMVAEATEQWLERL